MCVGGSRRGWSDYNRFIENLWDCLVLISDIPTHGNKWQVVTVLHLCLHTPILVTAVQLFRKPAFFPETGIASHSAASQLWRSFTVKYSWGDLSDQNHQKHLCHHDLRHPGAEDGRGESRCQVSKLSDVWNDGASMQEPLSILLHCYQVMCYFWSHLECQLKS